MEVRVPYGRSTVSASIPDSVDVDLVELSETPASPDPLAEVRRALEEPLGAFAWPRPDQVGSVAIAINDKTRPVPHQYLLPPLIDRLTGLGLPDAAITFFIAVGAHPPMDPSEFSAVVPPDILSRFRVVSHDSERNDDLVSLGDTARGTPVWVNRHYVEADLEIAVGAIEPHQFMGFSGGVKSAAIGLAGLATINANHTLMTHPDSRVGSYVSNPARQDVEEIGALMGVDLALNGILNQRRQIVQALSGDPAAVMERGTPIAQRCWRVGVERDYGVVIASAGGHPKDINLYQAQKAVAAAAGIVRPGGTIILAAACPEGAGSRHYEDWVAGKRSQHEVLDAFRAEGFRIGPHKAFQLARDSERAQLIVCSDMSQELSSRLLLDREPDLQAAVDRALAVSRSPGPVAVLPHAASTMPYVQAGAVYQ